MIAVAEAYRTAVLALRHEPSYALPVPDSIRVLTVLRRWAFVASQEMVRTECAELGLVLADADAPPKPSRARPVVL